MQTKLSPYLSFKDTTRDAMTFYHTIFGGNLNMQTFKDFHAAQEVSEGDLIMHSELQTDGGLTLMASDTPSGRPYSPGNNFSISLTGDNEKELRGYFEKLADGGTTTMPLEKAPWGDMFGMCTDKFGITWLVNVSASAPAPQPKPKTPRKKKVTAQ